MPDTFVREKASIILSGNEISQILLSLILSYTGGQRNRPRYIAWGVVFCALSCFILALPHLIYGPGQEALELTKEYVCEYNSSSAANSTLKVPQNPPTGSNKLCLGIVKAENCDEIFSIVPLALLFLSQFVLGIGNTLYYSLGQSYIDDNTSRAKTPMMLAYAMSLRTFGPVAGYGLGYLCLNLYIDPTKTPLIDNKDHRWLGAWWIGWIFLGFSMLLFSFLIRMFPSKIRIREKNQSDKGNYEMELLDPKHNEPNQQSKRLGEKDKPTLKELPAAVMRLLRNKILICNIVSSIFYVLGSTGYILFLSKYIEVQFNKSPSDATIITGPVTLAGMMTGLMISGIIITRYMAGQVIYAFLSCEHSTTSNLAVNSTSQCNMHCLCEGVAYSPVCYVKTGTTFFSPCHAACNYWDNEKKIYAGCSCASELFSGFQNYEFTFSNPSTYNNTEKKISSVKNNTTMPSSENRINNFNENPDTEKGGTDVLKRSFSNNNKDSNFLKNIMAPGTCFKGCVKSFYLFTFIMFVINWLGSTGRITNVLLNLRSVAETDKSFSQGLYLMLVSLFAFTPGPIIYGFIIDSTCLEWNYKCGNRGNCMLYDPDKFRMYVNLTGVSFTFVGVFFDILVWYFAKNIDLYGEPDVIGGDRSKRNERKQALLDVILILIGSFPLPPKNQNTFMKLVLNSSEFKYQI
ncbi:Solute carrier organic anion transporter family member 5A1 [Pseudolycoriella hygida]|uniref:Solute carrier organic anion transporter family member 5A1 n=1 Tax=Pseudolycoriella hygida TaxID=35572 RepID=A0A9Q0NDD6_9DIPT|nr:Solute carrier organic anion transporter family member 5A1 [Pseudolycoriella hygida]